MFNYDSVFVTQMIFNQIMLQKPKSMALEGECTLRHHI